MRVQPEQIGEALSLPLCACHGVATVQVALRKAGGRWHLSSPMCRGCAETYGMGSVTRWDGREELAL